MSWPAKYPGRCASCREPFPEDEPIRFVAPDDRRVVHEDCGGAPPGGPVRPDPEPCPVCWLTHPPGACDR